MPATSIESELTFCSTYFLCNFLPPLATSIKYILLRPWCLLGNSLPSWFKIKKFNGFVESQSGLLQNTWMCGLNFVTSTLWMLISAKIKGMTSHTVPPTYSRVQKSKCRRLISISYQCQQNGKIQTANQFQKEGIWKQSALVIHVNTLRRAKKDWWIQYSLNRKQIFLRNKYL